MIPTCATLLECRGFGLRLLKSTFNAENFICRLFLSYFQPILALFTLEMRVAAQNRKKFTKTRYFGGSRSSMLTFLRSSTPVLVMIGSMSVPICNHFHVRRAYSSKITLFKGGAPLSPPRSKASPLPSGMKFCHEILETLSYHMVKTQNLYLTWSLIGTRS